MALREGKIAHVIHHFSIANRLAETPSQLEISRVNMLETLEKSKKTALRIASLAFPAVIVGLILEDDLIANIGWVVTTFSLLSWTGIINSCRLISQRLPYDLINSDD